MQGAGHQTAPSSPPRRVATHTEVEVIEHFVPHLGPEPDPRILETATFHVWLITGATRERFGRLALRRWDPAEDPNAYHIYLSQANPRMTTGHIEGRLLALAVDRYPFFSTPGMRLNIYLPITAQQQQQELHFQLPPDMVIDEVQDPESHWWNIFRNFSLTRGIVAELEGHLSYRLVRVGTQVVPEAGPEPMIGLVFVGPL